ncbi:ABC transporter substrate-binding protein [Agrobacterium larrymoorei]|uniref:Spermidine/putrescine transport system substrate-binding protein n=1 Tax=Agrobacterium larrymoorei TaxID=160699 RepID=A0ABU0UDD6_9HYPH|nr:ABC transporter substrate-binding protein [Agrobacterium larrymoorei]MDQ1182917.1 putative spermidine/putrescine transport system substrate-binding protein [Agrobacterium larrymoorei]
MMNMNRRQILAGMGGMTAATMLGLPAGAQSKTLVVPTLGGAWEQFWRQTMAPAFTQKSGAQVTLDAGNGRVWSANLRAAGPQKPPYSILMTNEAFASSLRKEGFFEKLDLAKLPNYADLYPLAKKTDGWGAIAMVSPIGLAYRTDMVQTPPKGWKDLWENPEFKGRIGLYNFANTAGKMELMLASKIFGKDQYDVDAGFKALEKLGPVIQADFNLSTGIASGEFVVAPFDFGEVARLRSQGLPIDVIVPEEGLLMFDQTLNILANGPEKDLAYQYANFLLSPEGQVPLMKQFFVSPTNAKVIVPDDLKKDVPISGEMMDKILTWDWAFMNEKQAGFAETWAKVMK